jgi:hypothetical protein
MQPSIQSLPHWVQLVLLIVPAASATFAAIGLLLTFCQSRRTNAQARAALVAACLEGLTEDKEIQCAFYLIEYSKFQYDVEGFHDSDQERQIDKLLRHFANIALAWQVGLLSICDVRPIQYYVLRVMRDPNIQEYLTFIAQWSQEKNLGEHPYAVLSQLSEKLANCPRTQAPQACPYVAQALPGEGV